METLNFNECTLASLDTQFGLRKQSLAQLYVWLNTDLPLDDWQKHCVQHLSQTLAHNAPHWNEQDLSLHFIGPMFSLVGFTEPYRFNLFAQSSISALVQGVLLTGRVDELVASGFRTPQTPFFAISEYKRQTDPFGDPAGQSLAAMLVGQTLNNHSSLPMYGCYVIGALWWFMVLEGKAYAMSNSFDGTDYQDACQILRILLQLKQYCMERTEIY